MAILRRQIELCEFDQNAQYQVSRSSVVIVLYGQSVCDEHIDNRTVASEEQDCAAVVVVDCMLDSLAVLCKSNCC